MVDIKTIRAKDKKSALAKATVEYGNNFTILSNKEVKVGGFLGIGQRTEYELRIMLNSNVFEKYSSGKESAQSSDVLQAQLNTQKIISDRKELVKHTETIDGAQMAERILAVTKSLKAASKEKYMNSLNGEKISENNSAQVQVIENKKQNSKQNSIDKIKNEIHSKQNTIAKSYTHTLAADSYTEDIDKKVQELVDKKLKDFMQEYLNQRTTNINNITKEKASKTRQEIENSSGNKINKEEVEHIEKLDKLDEMDDRYNEYLKNSQMADIVDIHSEDSKKNVKQKNNRHKTENIDEEVNVTEKLNGNYQSSVNDYVDISMDKIAKSRKVKEDEETIDSYLLKLRRMEFPDEAIYDIKDYLLSSSDARFFESHDVVKREINRYFVERLNLLDGIDVSDKKKIIVLVGPTGVGKTTTIPKIASKHLKNGKNVSFVTIDNYRIAAVDQLQRYANIMKIPFSAATTPDALRAEVRKMESNSVLFVDTMGRSPKGAEDIVAMSKYFATVGRFDIDIQLVISATVKYNDALNILNAFKVANYRGVILTKLDETDYLASSLSAILKNKVPITYTTFGQNVPKDITTAKKYSKQIFEGLLGFND